MAALTVVLVTPERSVLATDADSVVVPAHDGELGILRNHAPLLAQLQPGEIRIARGGVVEAIAVSGGFIEVRKNRVFLFTETAEMAKEIDAERARQAVLRAKSQLKSANSQGDLANAEAALRRALVRIRVLESSRRSKSSIQ